MALGNACRKISGNPWPRNVSIELVKMYMRMSPMIGPSANDKIAPSYRSLYAILRHDTRANTLGFLLPT